MSEQERLSRREFLSVIAMAAAGATVVACQPQTVIVKETVEVEKQVEKEVTTIVEVEKPVEKEVTKIVEKEKVVKETVEVEKVSARQAPTLQDQVKAGQLPALDERLPLEPRVVDPIEEIGQYGGSLRVGTTGTALVDADGDVVTGCYSQNFLRLTPDLASGVPNIATAWKAANDGMSVTVYMRKGLKWADGQPFTADDMMFWYNDILLNKDLTPVPFQFFRPGGEVMQVVKDDDYTITFRFPVPHASFTMVCLMHKSWFGNGGFAPAHYLEQFHVNHNAEAAAVAKAQNYDTWYQYFSHMWNYDENPDVPTLNTYTVRQDTVDTVFLQRNPYYWATDSEGNQLPYIDEVVQSRVSDLEMYNAKIVSGEYDFAGFNTNIMNYSAYGDGAAQGNYHILVWKSGKGSEVVYQANLTYGDLAFRSIFQDARFRRALSLAINRDEINEVIYFGRATPRQMTVNSTSKLLKPEYEQAWVDYDPEQANAFLDELGLKWDAAHKVRQRPDGEPMSISWDFAEGETPKGPITELVKKYWEAVGIQINVKAITRTLLAPKVLANEEPMGLWHGDMVSDVLIPRDKRWFIGEYRDDCDMCPLWSQWSDTKGEQGEEPPDWWKEKADWFETFRQTMDPQWMHKVLQSQAENIWTIGTVGDAPQPIIVRNTLHNVVDTGIWAYDSLWTYPYDPEQWFFKEG
jgi:peptide/nickel transport system substrate-binding protein